MSFRALNSYKPSCKKKKLIGYLYNLVSQNIFWGHASTTIYLFLTCNSDISGSTHQKDIFAPFHLPNILCSCNTDVIVLCDISGPMYQKYISHLVAFYKWNIYRTLIWTMTLSCNVSGVCMTNSLLHMGDLSVSLVSFWCSIHFQK